MAVKSAYKNPKHLVKGHKANFKMKIAFTAAFLSLAQLSVAQDFIWRRYNNGGCNHSSPASATFPPLPDAPKS
ncbi:hypothetical protein C8J57DRAFT_1541602 [Mycena rebaudengoi]|nr:hypothetical protein C8J57DRAFT_1541602 [Mycena rebaudengoi]